MTRLDNIKRIKELKDEIEFIYTDAEKVKWNYIDTKKDLLEAKRNEIKLLRNSLEPKNKKVLDIPVDVAKWFKEYISGVDWGYGGIKISYVSPKQKYVIVTNAGSIGGTGTAMGTSSYYYSPSSHWIAKVGSKCIEKASKEFEGRLIKQKKEEWIKQILEWEYSESN